MSYKYDLEHITDRIEKALEHGGYKTHADFVKAFRKNEPSDSTRKITEQDFINWGKGTKPRIDKLLIICEYCDCDIDYLLGKDGINTFKAENHTIQEEIGLSEAGIDILRSIKQTPQSDETMLIDLFIRRHDAISKYLWYTTAFIDTIKIYGSIIDMDYLKEEYARISANQELGQREVMRQFEKAFSKKYPPNKYPNLPKDFAFDVYELITHNAAHNITDEHKYDIGQSFNRIVDEYIELHNKLSDELLSGETASEDK